MNISFFTKPQKIFGEQKIFYHTSICKKYLAGQRMVGWRGNFCLLSLRSGPAWWVSCSVWPPIIWCKNKTTTKFSSCATLCQSGLTSGSSLGLPRVRGRGGSVRGKNLNFYFILSYKLVAWAGKTIITKILPNMTKRILREFPSQSWVNPKPL